MSLRVDAMQTRKCKMSKIWVIALTLAVFTAGCGRQQAGNPFTTLSSISPNSGTQGQNVAVTLTGTNFATGATIGLSGTGITVSNTTVVSSTQITATLAIAANAATGARNVTVTSSGSTTSAVTFTVNTLLSTLARV